MTTATAAPTRGRSRATAPTTAVIPQSLSQDDLMALLGQTGAVATGGSDFHRMTLKGGILETDDGGMFPPRKGAPALTVRIVKPPVYYNAFFLGDREEDGSIDAGRIGRSDLNGRFCKKYDDPAEQAADANPANDVYDEIAKLTGKRGTFKADIQVQIVPESGEMTGDEVVYTLSLSTTSVFEWRGSTKNPAAGSVSDTNFIVRLANLAAEQAVAAGADETGQKKAVLDALTSLRLGGVIADVDLVRTSNPEKPSVTWTVIVFNPIHIEPLTETPELEAGDASSDDVPF